uniref:Galectin n=1 Tax=Ciona savignyi TaxID=51511 RepID=H2YEJ8_CIOSA
MSQPSIVNPVVPFTEHVNGMFPGRTFTIVGTAMPNANRFYINLQPHGGSDIAMHFNPRFDQNKIVLNNREGGVWKNEEIHLLGSSFVRGKLFKLIIFCWEDSME